MVDIYIYYGYLLLLNIFLVIIIKAVIMSFEKK